MRATHLFCCSCCRSWTAIFLRSSTSFSSSSSSSASCSLSELGKVRNKITTKWLIRDLSRCGHTSIYLLLLIQFSLSQLPQGKVCPPKTGHQCVAGPAHLQTRVEFPVNLLCLSLVSDWDMQMIKGGNLLAPLSIEVADWCELQCNSVESHHSQVMTVFYILQWLMKLCHHLTCHFQRDLLGSTCTKKKKYKMSFCVC